MRRSGRSSDHGEVDVDLWPDPDLPAAYGAARAVVHQSRDLPATVGVVQRWYSAVNVGFLWPTSSPLLSRPEPTAAFDAVPDLEVVIRVGAHRTPWGPDVYAVNRAGVEKSTRWADLAAKLGVVLPWWPRGLCAPELLLRWRPRAPTVTALAEPILDVAPLLRAAATFPEDHPTRRTMTTFARALQHRSTAAPTRPTSSSACSETPHPRVCLRDAFATHGRIATDAGCGGT